jgi:hypothetical protein
MRDLLNLISECSSAVSAEDIALSVALIAQSGRRIHHHHRSRH